MSLHRSIRALVVDDEAPARRRLADLMAQDDDIECVGEAESGTAAIAAIRDARPDILFLDVQMPGLDGFGVIDAIGPQNMPLTVFVTAYDRFAMQAFEAEAVDYLLKPFGDRRYEATIERVKRRLHELRAHGSKPHDSFGPELLKLMNQRTKPGEIWDWIVVKARDNTRLIMAEDIDWIDAAGVYVTVHAKAEEFLYRAALATVAEKLDPFRFVRIHRSTIVNLKSIASLERRSHGEFDIVLKDGERLLLSRTYRSQFEIVLGQQL